MSLNSPGTEAHFDSAQMYYQDFNYNFATKRITFVDRDTSISQCFFACNIGNQYDLFTAPNPDPGPENAEGCFKIMLTAVAYFIPPTQPTLPLPPAPTTNDASTSSSSFASSSSPDSTPSSLSPVTTTVSLTQSTSVHDDTTSTSISTSTEIPTNSTTTSEIASSISHRTTFPAIPTPGTPFGFAVIVASDNSALEGLTVIPFGNSPSGVLIVVNATEAVPFQFVDGFLRFATGVYAIVNRNSRSPVNFSFNSTATFGFSRPWSLSTSQKRQVEIPGLIFSAPDGAAAIFYTCQVGGPMGNYVLFSTFESSIPPSCYSLSLGINVAMPSLTTRKLRLRHMWVPLQMKSVSLLGMSTSAHPVFSHQMNLGISLRPQTSISVLVQHI